MPELIIIGVTADRLEQIFRWYRQGRGTFFLVDPHAKSLFITAEDIGRCFERKYFIYEYFIVKDETPVGFLRMLPDQAGLSLVFDLWLENFSEDDSRQVVELLKKYWLDERRFHKLETRIIFEKGYLKILKESGFKTENIMKSEYFADGIYWDMETLGYLKSNA